MEEVLPAGFEMVLDTDQAWDDWISTWANRRPCEGRVPHYAPSAGFNRATDRCRFARLRLVRRPCPATAVVIGQYRTHGIRISEDAAARRQGRSPSRRASGGSVGVQQDPSVPGHHLLTARNGLVEERVMRRQHPPARRRRSAQWPAGTEA